MNKNELFWDTSTAYSIVTRRYIFPFGNKKEELTVTIAPEHVVPNIATTDAPSLKKAIIPQAAQTPGATISPQLFFAVVKQSSLGTEPVVGSSDGHELRVAQLVDENVHKASYDIQTLMTEAHTPLPSAIVAPGDDVVGFLYDDRRGVRFYPILTVSLPEDLISFLEGSGTTDDVIPLLPFQS